MIAGRNEKYCWKTCQKRNEDWAGHEVRIGRVTWMPDCSSTGWMWNFGVGVRATWDMYELNKHPLSLGYCKMAALEGLEEKLSAIWYIEIPTHFTSGLGNLTRWKCSKGARDTIDQDQLKNQKYLIRFGHTKALLFSKKGHILAKIPVLGNLTHMWTGELDSP